MAKAPFGLGKHGYALMIAVAAGLGGLLFGYDTGLISGAILFVRQQFHLTSVETEVAVSIVLAGAAIGACFAGSFGDRYGRRPLLLFGIRGMMVSLTFLGYLFGAQHVSRVAILSDVFVYLACFAIGLGPVFWLLISEIYSTSIRGQAMSVASVTIWIFDLVVSVTFLSLIGAVGAKFSFWICAAACVVAFVFAFRLVQETKGRTLEDIEESWSGQPTPFVR